MELRESYNRDVLSARKALSNVEARLEAEKGAMAVVESRLAMVTEESKQAWSKLIELESTSSALKGEVRGLLVVC